MSLGGGSVCLLVSSPRSLEGCCWAAGLFPCRSRCSQARLHEGLCCPLGLGALDAAVTLHLSQGSPDFPGPGGAASLLWDSCAARQNGPFESRATRSSLQGLDMGFPLCPAALAGSQGMSCPGSPPAASRSSPPSLSRGGFGFLPSLALLCVLCPTFPCVFSILHGSMGTVAHRAMGQASLTDT